ncbi:MAG: hypothetical protein H3C34_01245 [Caldilineaceae bacterium]|nr:hypothetical protein [Caldilineaceae bacterium]
MSVQRASRDISPKDRSTAFLIFGFLLACYMLTYTGRIDSSDGLSMFATTESFVRHGGFDSNQLLWMGNQQGNIGADGSLYSRKGLGMVLLGIPLVWLAKQWPSVGLVQSAMLLNPLLTAWTGALLFRAGRRLGWRRHTAMATALLFGLFTMAWPYTQTYFSDPICSWGLFAAAYGLLSYGQSGRKHYLLGAGLAWAIAYLARAINLLTLPIYLAGLFLVLETSPWQRTAGSWPTRLRLLFWRYWRPVVVFMIPVAAAGLISLWWNWIRFGSIWDTGYVETEAFTAEWLFGLFGLTAGPARGLLWYNPILLLSIPGAIWFWRQQRRILFLTLLLVGLYFAVYAKWYMWHGGFSWGPRFMVPILPFLSLLTGPAWNSLVHVRGLGRVGWAAGIVLAVLSLAVQWLGLLVPYGLVQDWLVAAAPPLFAPETFTALRFSPLLLQFQFLSLEQIQLAWWRGTPWPDTIDWLPLSMALAGLLVGLLFLRQQMRSPRRDDREERVRNWLYGAALAVLTIALLTYYQVALSDPELSNVAKQVHMAEQPGDAILLLWPEQSQAFADSYGGDLPVYGFSDHEQLDVEEQAWLQRLENQYRRLWVVPSYLPPEQSGWELPLRTGHFLLVDNRVSGPSNQRIALYALQPAQDMTEAGLGTVFGDPAAQEPISEAVGWIRLNGYAITPAARPGGEILLTLLWESIQPVEKNYQVFVHLLDNKGDKIAQRDGQPVQWLRPTSTWQPGEEIVDRYGILLPGTLARGRYTIAVGLYDPVTGQRLPVSAGPSSYAIELGPIDIQ